MKHHYFIFITMSFLGLLLFSENAEAQFSIQHQAPTIGVAGELIPLEFILPGIGQSQINEAVIFYRTNLDPGFSQKEIFLANGVFSGSLIVENNAATLLEYFFVVRLTNGMEITFPATDFTEAPVRVPIISSRSKEPVYEPLRGMQYIILSPEPGFSYAPDDAAIAVTLFYEIETIESGEFQLLLDGKDVTGQADISDYFISYIPEKLSGGMHKARLLYQTQEKTFEIASWGFRVIDAKTNKFSSLEPQARPAGELELTARNQTVGGDINDALTGRLSFSGKQGLFSYSVNGFLTSQESSRLQPQNRFGVRMNYGRWWSLQAGHIFPQVTTLSMAGRRMMGVQSELHVLNEKLNFEFLYGELNRKITNRYEQIIREEIFIDGIANPVDTTFSLPFANRGVGAFRQELIGGRVAFGNKDKLQIGVHLLKIEDDTTSIQNIRNFSDIGRFGQTQLTTTLGQNDIQKLEASPELLSIAGAPKPQGNLVAGANVFYTGANRKVQIESEFGLGVLNQDITGGELTRERAEELGFELTEDDEDALDRLSKFIIINENMLNFPFRLREREDGSTRADIFFPTAILASNTVGNFNYFNNNISIQYRWIGPDYRSLANTTVRNDIAGFTLSDRFRMAQNRLFLTVGLETLDDNVVGNLASTTTTNTYRTNLSWFPIRNDLPRMNVGIRFRTRENGIGLFNPNLSEDLQKFSVRNFALQDGDTLNVALPRKNETITFNGGITQSIFLFEMQHSLSVNYTNLQTTDDVFGFGDTKSNAISLTLNTAFITLPLNTSFGFSLNNTETNSGLSEVNILGLFAGGNYRMLENKLLLNGRVAITSNVFKNRSISINSNGTDTLEDDFFEPGNDRTRNTFSSYVLNAGAVYTIDARSALSLDANLTAVGGGNSNDRIVELRYIFRF